MQDWHLFQTGIYFIIVWESPQLYHQILVLKPHSNLSGVWRLSMHLQRTFHTLFSSMFEFSGVSNVFQLSFLGFVRQMKFWTDVWPWSFEKKTIETTPNSISRLYQVNRILFRAQNDGEAELLLIFLSSENVFIFLEHRVQRCDLHILNELKIFSGPDYKNQLSTNWITFIHFGLLHPFSISDLFYKLVHVSSHNAHISLSLYRFTFWSIYSSWTLSQCFEKCSDFFSKLFQLKFLSRTVFSWQKDYLYRSRVGLLMRGWIRIPHEVCDSLIVVYLDRISEIRRDWSQFLQLTWIIANKN